MKKKTLYFLRALLVILIVLNLGMIYSFSAQNAEESTETSRGVTRWLAQICVKDFEQLSPHEQTEIITQMNPTVRKIAHFGEFGCLGGLSLLLLLTWKGKLVIQTPAAWGFTLCCAVADELHQLSSDKRAFQFSDIVIDMLGATLACATILGIVFWVRYRKKHPRPRFSVTRYRLSADAPRLRLAVVSDLHGNAHEDVIETLKNESPDLILIPGDLTDDTGLSEESDAAYDFLRRAAIIAPTYYSLGNHEIACYHKGNPWRHPTPVPLSAVIKERIRSTGVTLLDNDFVHAYGMVIGGLSSGINGKENTPDAQLLQRFAAEEGYHLLLCHHPEYYVPHVKPTEIELTVCGHAHGGQWRFFGIAVYAPGQGLFPRYTSGVLEDRCVISRGIGDHTWIPRIGNRRELIIIEPGSND